MKSTLVKFLICFLMISLAIWVNSIQAAEKYPARPINLINPTEAGADPDILLRPWAEKVSKLLGKPLVMVNKPGAAQTIGYRETYESKPNGYTIGICMASVFLAKMQGIYPYDHHNFTPLCVLVKSYPVIIASTKTAQPFKTIQEVFSFAKDNPGKIKTATSTTGGPAWFTSQLVQEAVGVKFNIIPQEGAGALIVSQVLGGHTDLGFTYIPAAKPQIDAGNIRCLAVVGPERFPGEYNKIPTLKELGYDASLVLWIGILGPPKMPKDIMDKLAKAFSTAADDPEVQKHWMSRYYSPAFLPPAQMMSLCDEQSKMYQGLLMKAGVLKKK